VSRVLTSICAYSIRHPHFPSLQEKVSTLLRRSGTLPTSDVEATVRQIPGPGAAGADIVRIAVDSARTWRPSGDPRADRGQPVGRPAGELPPGRRGRAVSSTRSATNRAPAPPRKDEAVAGEGRLPGGGGGEARLRRARRRELRVDRSRQGGPVRDDSVAGMWSRPWSTRPSSTTSDSRAYCVSLKDSEPRKSSTPTSRFAGGPSGRAAAPRGDRGRPPARGSDQDARRVRAAHLARHRRHHPGVASRFRTTARARRSPPAARSSRTSPAGASGLSREPRPETEHHLLSLLLAGRERGVRRAGGKGAGGDGPYAREHGSPSP